MSEVMSEAEAGAGAGALRCEGCGGAASKTCRGCGAVHYCGSKCQRAAWPSHRAVCRRVQAEAAREGRPLFAEELTAAPGRPRSTICMERKGPPFPVKRSCLCSGDDAYAHTACLAEALRHYEGGHNPCTILNNWGLCQECKGRYEGELGLELAWTGCAEARKYKDLYSELLGLERVRRLHFQIHDNFQTSFDAIKERFKEGMELLQLSSPMVAKYVTHKTMVTVHEDLLPSLDLDDASNVAQFAMSLDESQAYFMLQRHDGGFGMTVKTQTVQIMALSEASDRELNALAVRRGRAAIEWATCPLNADIDMEDRFRSAVLARLRFVTGVAMRNFDEHAEEGVALIKSGVQGLTALFGPHHPSVKHFKEELDEGKLRKKPWPTLLPEFASAPRALADLAAEPQKTAAAP